VQVAAAAVALAPWAKVPAAQAPTAPGAWGEIWVNITDGHFGRRCGPRGADIVLSATRDTIVHGFEIYRIGSGGGGSGGGGGGGGGGCGGGDGSGNSTAPPASSTPLPPQTPAQAPTPTQSSALPQLQSPMQTPTPTLAAALGAAPLQGAGGAAGGAGMCVKWRELG
jgi:hypothetical protein